MIDTRKTKTLISISLFNKWYFALSFLLILMQAFKIIHVHPIWLLSPIWLPTAVAIALLLLWLFALGITMIIQTIMDIRKNNK